MKPLNFDPERSVKLQEFLKKHGFTVVSPHEDYIPEGILIGSEIHDAVGLKVDDSEAVIEAYLNGRGKGRPPSLKTCLAHCHSAARIRPRLSKSPTGDQLRAK